MSNLATAARLRRATSQLPVSWYCDPARARCRAAARCSRARPGYVGHELMVPEVGDYYALAARDNAQALVRNAEGIELLSNICRHRQAIMLNGRGNAPNIVCPIHRWTYDLKGELLGAPHFDDKPCLNLGRSPLHELERPAVRRRARRRARPRAASALQRLRLLGLRARPRRDARVQLQLEDVHRGLPRGLPRRPVPSRASASSSPATTCAGNSRERASRADRRRQQRPRASRARQTYERWHKAVLDYYRGEMPPHGAIWLTYYPNVMVEWYPHVLVISTLIPRGGGPDDQRRRVLLSRGHRAVRARVRRGRAGGVHGDRGRGRRDRASAWTPAAARCTRRGAARIGPYQSPMEDGMQHFHEFYRREMESRLVDL